MSVEAPTGPLKLCHGNATPAWLPQTRPWPVRKQALIPSRRYASTSAPRRRNAGVRRAASGETCSNLRHLCHAEWRARSATPGAGVRSASRTRTPLGVDSAFPKSMDPSVHRASRRTRPQSTAAPVNPAMRNPGLEESAGSPDENKNRCRVRFRLRHNGSVSNVADRHPALAENVNHMGLPRTWADGQEDRAPNFLTDNDPPATPNGTDSDSGQARSECAHEAIACTGGIDHGANRGSRCSGTTSPASRPAPAHGAGGRVRRMSRAGN